MNAGGSRWAEGEAWLRSAHPRWAAWLDQNPPCPLEPRRPPSTFQALLRAIIYQQLSGKAAATIYARITALAADPADPRPADFAARSDPELRSAGLSRGKLAALRDLARRSEQGEVPEWEAAEQLPDAALLESLTAVRGIGPWTVQMLLIFNLCRPDVWPVNDLGIQRGLKHLFGRRTWPDAAALERAGRPWRPHRTVVAWHLWRASEVPPAAQ